MLGNIKVRFTFAPFVPKPFTPFQWCGMNFVDELKEKIKKVYFMFFLILQNRIIKP